VCITESPSQWEGRRVMVSLAFYSTPYNVTQLYQAAVSKRLVIQIRINKYETYECIQYMNLIMYMFSVTNIPNNEYVCR